MVPAPKCLAGPVMNLPEHQRPTLAVRHDDMANAIRALTMDAVEAANSGHPGMPMGMADAATVLFTRFLRFDPAWPEWPDRDRFVLSAGHASMLLYALLHLSGYGLPFAMVLMKPDLDQWKPGEHNGTFRGHNLAFVTAAAALNHYWRDDKFAKEVQKKADIITDRFREIANSYDDHWFYLNGRGMMQGLVARDGELAEEITKACFKRQLVIETSGADDQVIKTLCPLTISEEDLTRALDIVKDSVSEVMTDRIKRGEAHSVSSLAG